jgi:ABC-type molybdenum transport system ATPase subunit/photorepair protein PhrA
MEKILYCVRGIAGSGKSTFAKTLGGRHYEADMFFIDPILGEYKFDGSKIKLAHEWCQNRVEGDMVLNVDKIVVSNTFIKRGELAKYTSLGFPYEIIECKGNYENVHGVPAEVVARMKANYQETIN